jgi:hypothetical protein
MDDDDTPTVQHGAGPGRVARLGMAGFVRAHGNAARRQAQPVPVDIVFNQVLCILAEAAGPSSTVGVEVVQSRRVSRAE